VAPRELSFTIQHYAGDKLDVVVDLTGEAVAEPPVFELLVEHRDKLRDIDIGTKYKDPEPIQVQPATFTRGSDGSYRTLMDLPRAGLDRIAVRAHGVTASGQAFQDEAFISNSLEVRPVVARLLSLSANAVATAGSQFDHLDVTANLDVIEPGEYWMVFQLRDRAGKALSGPGVSGKSTLQRGRQALTVPVPGGKVWSELGDGPIEVANVAISRINTFRSSFVRTDGASARTDIYKRSQWNPGGFYGEDTVTLHRLATAPSGRYRLAEVQWEVTTPGGKCYWNGWLGERISVVGGGLPGWLDFNGEGVLTPGRTVLSFIFDGTAVAAAPNRKPVFNAGMNCDSDPTKEGIRSHPQTLALNPSEFEPPTGTFFIESRNPVRIEAGALGSTTLLVRDKTAAQVRFTVKQAPPELETNLVLDTRPNASAFARLEIHPKPGTKPGRYYVEVEAASGKESAGAVVVVDVATGRPQVAALQELPPAPSRAALADAPSCEAIRTRLRQGSGIVALDPVPDLMADKRIVADPEALAIRGRRVTGLAADGEATIVLRIPANFEGERITVTVMNDLGRPSRSQNEDGSLASVQNADVRLSRLTTVAMKTSRGPMAFVLYRSPSDFNRDGRDDRAASRGITFQIESVDAPCFSFNWPR